MVTFYNFTNSVTQLAIIYAINLLLILGIIFAERKSPSATLAWVMVLAFLPVVGIVFYIIFNQNFSRSKINKLTEREEFAVSNALKQQIEDMNDDEYEFACPKTKRWKHLIKLNQVYGHAFYTEDNQIELITDGVKLQAKIFEDMRNAKKSINVEYYIIKNDFVGMSLINLLREYLRAGGKVGYFFKPKMKIIAPKFNYRNHRKIIVIDDKIGYTGGYNVAKEYIGRKKRFGYWRDTHVRIEGNAVIDLRGRFVLDWRFTTREQLEIVPKDYEWKETETKTGIQIVSCGPESPSVEVKRAMMRMITYAEKRVFLQTPYFVPDPSIFESLKMAAQSGVDVRVMIPCKPDHIFVYWATYSYVGELLRSGGRVFIYDNGFLHAKTLVVDGEVGTVGSTNFDNRSFRLNFETNAFVFDSDFAKKMEDAFENDLNNYGHELTYEEYKKRSAVIKFKEAISRLLSDIL